jgi:hypothetical protein
MYAALYPDKIRVLGIDGNINPVGWFNRTVLDLAYRLNSDLGTYQVSN